MLASGAEGPADVLGAHICTGEARCFFSCTLLFTAKFIDPGLFLHGVAVGLERRGQQVYHLANGGAVFVQVFVKSYGRFVFPWVCFHQQSFNCCTHLVFNFTETSPRCGFAVFAVAVAADS